MAKKDPKIIRVGDKVRIVNPYFFVRVGYPLTPAMAEEEIAEFFSKEINEFLNKIKPTDSKADHPLSLGQRDRDKKSFDRVVRALSYDWVKLRGFGGRERKIYSEPVTIPEDCIATVISIKYVKTGTYEYGSGGQYNAWNGDYDDYQPAYLSDEKTHKILEVDYRRIIFADNDQWIEAANVEKIHEEEDAECLNRT